MIDDIFTTYPFDPDERPYVNREATHHDTIEKALRMLGYEKPLWNDSHYPNLCDGWIDASFEVVGVSDPNGDALMVGEEFPSRHAHHGMRGPSIPTDLASLLKRCREREMRVSIHIEWGDPHHVAIYNDIGETIASSNAANPTDALFLALAAAWDAKEVQREV